MRRFIAFGSGLALLLLGFALLRPFTVASAQTAARDNDTRLDQALRDIRDLRSLVTAQASRITNLERSVRILQDQLTTPVGSRSKTPEGWAGLRLGMSRADVEYILGPPKTADAVIDKQTLTYGTGTSIAGTVILVDDRVSQVNAPGFKMVLPEPNK